MHVRQIEFLRGHLRQFVTERIHAGNGGFVGREQAIGPQLSTLRLAVCRPGFEVRHASTVNAKGRRLNGAGSGPTGLLNSLRRSHKFERPPDVRLQMLARYDSIEHAVLEEKFAALKTFRQIFLNGFFNDTGARKADKRARR